MMSVHGVQLYFPYISGKLNYLQYGLEPLCSILAQEGQVGSFAGEDESISA